MIKEIIDGFKQEEISRAQLNQLWDEVAEVLAPERIGFAKTVTERDRMANIYDTEPLTSKRSLVNAIGGMLRPKSAGTGKWFDIVPDNEQLLEKRAVKEWVQHAEDRMWRAIYNPKARFIQATGEVDDDIVTFGTGCGFTGLRSDGAGLLFRSFHMKNVYIILNADGEVVGAYLRELLNAPRAAQRWGQENLGKKTQEALKGSPAERAKEFTFIWCIKPRYDRDPRKVDNLNMPVSSVVIDIESEHKVVEEGFEEFPLWIPRWDTRSGEKYGRGVGILALPDALTCNAMGKTLLTALHRAVDPPWLFPSDSMASAPKMVPGKVSYYDAKAVQALRMSNPFIQMESRANIPWGLDAQRAKQEQIQAVFYRNILNLPVNGPDMTATEYLGRKEEFVREIGAVFGRLDSDYNVPLAERPFNMMLRSGSFLPPPEELEGQNINFRFASPVEKAKQQIEEATIMQSVSKVIELGAVRPEVMDRYNWDEIGKFVAKSGDLPPSFTLDDEEYKALIDQKQQAAEAEAKAQMAERLVEGAAKIPQGLEA